MGNEETIDTLAQVNPRVSSGPSRRTDTIGLSGLLVHHFTPFAQSVNALMMPSERTLHIFSLGYFGTSHLVCLHFFHGSLPKNPLSLENATMYNHV